jgi:hypothetical protein
VKRLVFQPVEIRAIDITLVQKNHAFQMALMKILEDKRRVLANKSEVETRIQIGKIDLTEEGMLFNQGLQILH